MLEPAIEFDGWGWWANGSRFRRFEDVYAHLFPWYEISGDYLEGKTMQDSCKADRSKGEAVSSNYWSPGRIEEFRAKREAERLYLERIEAAALLYLYERDCMLCEMSAMEGEWPEGTGILKKRRKRMKMLYGIMKEQADGCVSEIEELDLIWGVLHRLCDRLDYTACVWSC